MSHSHDEKIPPVILLAAGAMIVIAITAVTVARWSGAVESETSPIAAVIEQRALSFVDQADGSVAVRSHPDGETVAVMKPGEDGFARGVMRGLARDRRLNDKPKDAPFQLVLWNGHNLSLLDPQTGARIELNAFGKTNVAAFARFLETENRKVASQ